MSKICFITTQQLSGSTVVGRVLPLAQELAKNHEVHVCVMKSTSNSHIEGIHIHETGEEPFIRTPEGKQRLHGISLIGRLKKNALQTAQTVQNIRPDIVVITKPLPQNALAAYLISRTQKSHFMLDCDDFELTANTLTSIWQRAVIHISERIVSRLAQSITVATPFLVDVWEQMTAGKKPVVLLPTGLNNGAQSSGDTPQLLYIGSISRSSGHRIDLLPEIIKQVQKELPNVKITIAGNGDDEADLKQKLTNVHFIGRFDTANVSSLLTKNTVIIDPIDTSITNRAKSSYRVALAINTGLPVVTSNIGIRTQLIPSAFHDRFFAAPENASDYAQKVISLIKNPLTESERQLLQNHSQQYTWEKLADRFMKLIPV